MWSVPTYEGRRLLKVSDEEFVDNVNNALWKIYAKDDVVKSGMQLFEQLLDSLSIKRSVARQLPPSISAIVEGSRAAFPLKFGHSVSYVASGTVLVG